MEPLFFTYADIDNAMRTALKESFVPASIDELMKKAPLFDMDPNSRIVLSAIHPVPKKKISKEEPKDSVELERRGAAAKKHQGDTTEDSDDKNVNGPRSMSQAPISEGEDVDIQIVEDDAENVQKKNKKKKAKEKEREDPPTTDADSGPAASSSSAPSKQDDAPRMLRPKRGKQLEVANAAPAAKKQKDKPPAGKRRGRHAVAEEDDMEPAASSSSNQPAQAASASSSSNTAFHDTPASAAAPPLKPQAPTDQNCETLRAALEALPGLAERVPLFAPRRLQVSDVQMDDFIADLTNALIHKTVVKFFRSLHTVYDQPKKPDVRLMVIGLILWKSSERDEKGPNAQALFDLGYKEQKVSSHKTKAHDRVFDAFVALGLI